MENIDDLSWALGRVNSAIAAFDVFRDDPENYARLSEEQWRRFTDRLDDLHQSRVAIQLEITRRG